ncbi:MAG: UxaA family hydrolase [Methylobacteriaceae bacterium]|nr:UxaA family hydrolase [Methylobacteriaceae bacterium]
MIDGETDEHDPRLLLLSGRDNVLVARETIRPGETVLVGRRKVVLARGVARGHKLARLPIPAGEKILKYGAPIGSATRPIEVGEHVHVHNVKSDYTATHLIDASAGAEP